MWPECASYQEGLIKLQSLNVVNDCAERGVKLGSDFLAASKGEDHYQNVLQVVEKIANSSQICVNTKRTLNDCFSRRYIGTSHIIQYYQ
ncbi:hypothetical protein JTE90_026260 [Oedothorax gibbosus]|uniref:Uncharacterized protein n=1 Tax=Oedothorax gibbosus TaxID=931172 RepID=A0AAV6TV78_9ARAC|nr:hypothetical protein JTE90_026260 [Oedothorax gibbosus]